MCLKALRVEKLEFQRFESGFFLDLKLRFDLNSAQAEDLVLGLELD